MKATITCLLLFLPFSNFVYADPECRSVEEFIKTFDYLTETKGTPALLAEKARISKETALNCSGASVRFAKAFSTLTAAGIIGKDAARIATDLSAKSMGEVDSFLRIFRVSFSKDGLDLDLENSVRIARSLTLDSAISSELSRDDFENIAKACVNSPQLSLGKSVCSDLALRVAKSGEKWGGGIAQSFLNLQDFLTKKSELSLSLKTSIEIAERLTSCGGRFVYDDLQKWLTFSKKKETLGLAEKSALTYLEDLICPKPVATSKGKPTK